MLYLFDMDDTLITGYMQDPKKDFNRWEILPARIEKLAELRDAGHAIAIVSNQAGVAFGKVSVHEVEKKFADIVAALGLDKNTHVYVCYHHEKGRGSWRDATEVKRRKPSGEMIREAMHDLGFTQKETVYIGDRDVDEQAAKDANVTFVWVDAFFN